MQSRERQRSFEGSEQKNRWPEAIIGQKRQVRRNVMAVNSAADVLANTASAILGWKLDSIPFSAYHVLIIAVPFRRMRRDRLFPIFGAAAEGAERSGLRRQREPGIDLDRLCGELLR
jgi:hypothetical protein